MVFTLCLSDKPFKYKRLLAADIVRIPTNNEHVHDLFYINSEKEIKRLKRKALLQKIFSVATFGVVGLYLAHKNDCFKPIKKEVRNLLKQTDVQNKVKQFVNSANPFEHYPEFIKKYLIKLSESEKVNQSIKDEATKIIGTTDKLKQLIDSIVAKIKGESLKPGKTITQTEHNDGIFYALMENLQKRLEKDLSTNKKNGIPYKNKGNEVFENLFKQNGDNTPMDDLLYDVVKSRISEDIDKYLDNAIINAG